MSVEVRRDSFKNFWDKFSDKPDTNSMMLNNSAEELESSDRADILASLPILTNKDVVDIGAGIGRFTTVLAETAKSVISTDFIESFIKKNQERNAHLGNINYQVGDAVGLKMNNQSVDLVFTNWLMMYLSDSETVEFMFNTMRWLRPHGMVHLRESCSEPSTGRVKGKSMHNNNESNPTHYRFSSLYINLLRTIRYRDEENKLWKFKVHWSCSVPTYIKLSNNWRQVHWLAEKVPADVDDKETDFNYLVECLSSKWNSMQEQWDLLFDAEQYAWPNVLLDTVLDESVVPSGGATFIYTPRRTSPFVHIDAHAIACKFNTNIWNVELMPEFYRTSLTKSNTIKDKRVRYGWNQNLASSIQYWQQKEASFDAVVASELLAASTDNELENLKKILQKDSNIVTIEPSCAESVKTRLTALGYQIVSIEDVSEKASDAQQNYFKSHNWKDETDKKQNWVLVHAKL